MAKGEIISLFAFHRFISLFTFRFSLNETLIPDPASRLGAVRM